jgi:hypothetical protein
VSTNDPLAVAATSAQGFEVLQCEECARSMKHALLAAGHRGQIIEIRAAAGRYFIVCISYDGGRCAISQNGRHVGVRIGNMVFDNLHPQGMLFDRWLEDFEAVGGVAVTSVVDF